MNGKFIVVDPVKDFAILKGLASPTRVSILTLLRENGPTNVNVIAERLGLPQSSVSTSVRMLEDAGLVQTEARKARKGTQKICRAIYDELVIAFNRDVAETADRTIEVSMPLGLYSQCEVTGPCGICAPDGIIGLLDVPSTFLEPDRMKASLLWFTSGFVEYQFPNNAKVLGADLEAVDLSMEVSSEVPGTNADWPSDISVSFNGTELGVWTSPGDYGDKRGQLTPDWWKLRGSQYGMLKTWSVTRAGTFVDGVRISDVSIRDLDLTEHRSVRVRIEVKADAQHPGGINIFGRGFGNYDQDILLRLRRRT
ncbi:ArsR family transcriptional regulator [Psychromarinibacter sp. C21-152]|uniref:ArsR family transcriptional regulator n=1 Tax=Psychromarinibacter sediminicola TaxID=3033385 RepID=A0AAE3NSI5_9RHOB|nr:helix-turn-helix domain-containing protein [Psychromarinibacter sediminicola]MDF0601256.1 ArsR family transcriptional regulator [Psychromarinibacter sediminicola]